MPEFPHQLIRELQICSRAAAGLPGYKPDVPSLPALPSLASVIASEPTPPELRCVNCKGELLRGISSNICVYCGRHRLNDVVPEPICFNSTIGCQWLLRSLSLDGSEMVKPPIDNTERDKTQRSPRAEIPLSDFLNFRVAWAAEIDEEETSVSGQHAVQSTRYLSLTGVPPDNFFFKFKKDASSPSNEQPVLHYQVSSTGTSEASVHDGPNFFQHVQSSDLSGISLKDESKEQSFEWEADFQFSDSGNQHGVSSLSNQFTGKPSVSANEFQDSESFDRFRGSVVDLSGHMDSVFGDIKNLSVAQPRNDLAASPAFSDWNHDVPENIVSSKDSQIVEGLEHIVSSKDDHMLTNPKDLSTSVDLFDDFKWQANITFVTENPKEGNEHEMIKDDPFDEWNGFTGSSSLQDPSANDQNEWETNDTCVSKNTTKPGENKAMDDDSFDEGNDFTGSSSLQDPSGNDQNEWKKRDTSAPVKGITAMDDDSVDEWNNFTCSSSSQDPSRNVLNEWQIDVHLTQNKTTSEEHKMAKEDTFNEGNDFSVKGSPYPSGDVQTEMQSSNTCITESITISEENEAIDDDAVDEWNDFAGSSSSHNPSLNFWDEWQINDTHETDNATRRKEHTGINEDSFDEWNVFKGSGSSQDPPSNDQSELLTSGNCVNEQTTKAEEHKIINDGSNYDGNDFAGSIGLQDPSGSSCNEWQANDTHLTEDTKSKEHKMIRDDSFDEWNHLTVSSSLQDPSGNVQNKLQTSDKCATENTTKPEMNQVLNDDSVDAWSDFASSSGLQDPPVNNLQAIDNYVTESTKKPTEIKVVNDDTVDAWNDFSGPSYLQDPVTYLWKESKTNNTHVTESISTCEERKMIEDDSFDEWNDFTGPSSLENPSEKFQHELQTNNIHVTEHTVIVEENKTVDNYSTDEWNVFTGSTNLRDPSENFWNDWQTNGTCVTENMMTGKEVKKINGDPFDEWNDFTGSLYDPPGKAWNESKEFPIPVKKSAENDLFSSNSKPVEGDHNSLTQPDLYSTSTSNTTFHRDGNANVSEDPATDVWIEWQPNNTHVSESTTVGKENETTTDDSFDEWNDFTGSSSLQDPSRNIWNGWQTSDSNVAGSMMTVKEAKTTNDVPFDEWNDFSSSSSVKDSSGNVRNQSNEVLFSGKKSAEKSAKIDILSLYSTSGKGNYGSLSQPNLYSPSTSKPMSLAEEIATVSEDPAPRRSNSASGIL